MRKQLFLTAIVLSIAGVSNLWALSGTGGVPLGGMGTGYVTFTGDKFAVSGKMPPAGADKTEKSISASGFYLLAGTTAKAPAKATSEDAKCPLQTCDFGTVGGVKFNLNAFGPYMPGGGSDNFKLATSPLAMFDMAAVNSGTAAVDVAVAMEFANGGLLGGANSGTVDGNQAISFAGPADNAYLAVDCDGVAPAFSAGAVGTFSTDGKLANSDGNLVGAKCSVPAGGTVHFKFVLSWYRGYGSENYWYYNYYKNSKEAATFGLSKFDAVRNGITSFVSRVTASNFPDWYKDRLLNNTYPLIHNSVCAQDGRTAFWEGNYGIIGTIDQGEHAAVFYTFNWPDVQWHELQFCSRQQKSNGQIHHDFNQGSASFTAGSDGNNRHMLAWDDKTHLDYFWFPNTDTWADLNCMFIFKAYELMLATGNVDSMKKYWPAIKTTANRLVSQCGSSSKLPLQNHSTYDRCQSAGTNCSLTPEYNGGLAITTYQVLSEIAKFCGDSATAATFYDTYKAAKSEYKQLYGSSSTYGVSASVSGSGRFPESHIAGYSWANYLCLEPTMDKDWITATCKKMRDKQATGGVRANGEWIFYDVDHYGGAEIAIDIPDAAMVIHKQDYDYYYTQVPSQVLWQSLQEGDGNTHHDSYMTAPTVWHSYFQFCGYLLDNANNRLWIRPKVPTTMSGKITNALLLNPGALGTLNYEETPTANRTQTITIAYDAPVTVKEIVLANNTAAVAPSVVVINNGQSAAITVKTEQRDIENNIRVTLTTPIQIGPTGAKVTVSKVPDYVNGFPTTMPNCDLTLKTTGLLRCGNAIYFSVDRSGPVTMELVGLNGVKIGTILKESISAGNHAFSWNGKTTNNGPVMAGMALLRVSSLGGSITKPVIISK